MSDVQDQIGLDHLFQRGAEGGDQRRRQVGDEADGVGDHHLASMRQGDLAYGGVQRRKQLVLGQHPCPREPVEQAGLAGIGVADQGDDGELQGVPVALLLPAGALDLVEPLLQQLDAVLEQAPVALDLAFAGTAQETEAAALPLEVGPGPDQPAALVVEMSQLDLQHALAGAGAVAEDFEDERRAVQHLGAGFGLEVALLDRRQRRVDKQQLDPVRLDARLELLHHTGAKERRRPDFTDPHDLGEDHVHVDGARQALELLKPHLDRVTADRPANVGHDQAHPRRSDTMVNGFGAAGAALVELGFVRHARSLVVDVLGVKELDRRSGHDRRDRMLVDELRLRITAQRQAEIVKPSNHALQLDPIDQKYGHRDFLLANMIEKSVL